MVILWYLRITKFMVCPHMTPPSRYGSRGHWKVFYIVELLQIAWLAAWLSGKNVGSWLADFPWSTPDPCL